MILKIFKFLLITFVTFNAYADCYDYAGSQFGISPKLLSAISQVESNQKSGRISKVNSNGTYDMGIMQVNSSHLKKLQILGINRTDVVDNDCINILIGAYLLKKNHLYYNNSLQAIGAYNAGYLNDKNELRLKYAKKVRNMLVK